jgi:hypothetical protein
MRRACLHCRRSRAARARGNLCSGGRYGRDGELNHPGTFGARRRSQAPRVGRARGARPGIGPTCAQQLRSPQRATGREGARARRKPVEPRRIGARYHRQRTHFRTTQRERAEAAYPAYLQIFSARRNNREPSRQRVGVWHAARCRSPRWPVSESQREWCNDRRHAPAPQILASAASSARAAGMYPHDCGGCDFALLTTVAHCAVD